MEYQSYERYELIKTEIKKAQKNGDFKTEIFLAERFGFYYYAGKISRLHGLFKRAYGNFQKAEKKENYNKTSCRNNIEEIGEILHAGNFLKAGEIEENEYFLNRGHLKIIREYDIENLNKRIDNKIDERIISSIKKYEKGNRFSIEKINIYN